MASSFKLTNQLYLEGPVNLNDVVKKVKNAFSGIKIPIDKFVINAGARANLKTKIESLKPKINVTLGMAPGQTKDITAKIKAISPKIYVKPDITKSSINAISKSIQTALSSKSYTIKVTPIVSPVKLPSNINGGGGGAGTSAKTYKSLATSINHASGSIEKFGHDAALAFKRFAAYTVATAGLFALTRALRDSIGEAFDFQHELVRLGQITKKSLGELRELSGEVTKLSIKYGVSSNELIKVSSTLAQAGYNVRQTKEALETLAKVSLSPTFDGLENATEGLIALNSQFKDIQKTSAGYEKAFNAITAVSAAFAIESEDIVTAVRKTGGVFAAAGGTFNEFISLITSVRATTRESADSISTGLRTIFTRLQRRQTLEDLKQLGVTLVDTQNKFVGSYKAVELLSNALSRIAPNDVQYSQIAELLGGYRQIGKVIPLLQQFKTSQDALSVAQRSQNTLTEEAARAGQSYLVQIRKVKEEFNAFIRTITGGTAFKTMLEQTLLLTKSLVGLGKTLESILPAIGALAALKGISIAATFTSGINKGLLAGTFGGLAAGSKSNRSGNPFGGGKSKNTAGIGVLTAGAIALPSILTLLNNKFQVMDKTTQSLTTSIGLAAAGLLLFKKQLLGNFFGKGAGLRGLGGISGITGGIMQGNPAVTRRVASGVGNAALYGGLAAIAYGSNREGDSLDKISNGTDTIRDRQRYRSGQAIQGAGMGLIAGSQIGLLFSAIPVIGAFAPALGGLIGAIIGYTNILEDAEKTIIKTRTTASFKTNTEKFEKFIEGIRSGNVSPNNQQAQINSRISGLSTRQYTATEAEDRLTLRSSIQSTLLSFDIFNNSLIESSNSLEEFLAKGGDRTLAFSSQYTGRSVEDLKGQIQKSFGLKETAEQIKREAIIKEAILLEEQLYVRSLGTAMIDASDSADSLGNSFNDLKNIVDKGPLNFSGRAGFSTLGDNPVSNVNQFRKASEQAIGLFGSTPEIANKLLSEVTASATLSRDLPTILAEFASARKNSDTDDTAKDFILSRLDISSLPETVRKAIENGLDSISSDPSGDTPGLIQQIVENKNKVSEQILENSGLELNLELLKNASDSFISQINTLSERLNQAGQRETAVRDLLANNVKTRYAQELAISQARKITTTTFDADRASRAEQEAFLGRTNRNLAGNSSGIIARIRANRIAQRDVNAKINDVTDSKDVIPLQKQFKDLQVEATGLEKAFNVLINNTEKAAIIQDKLSQAQEGSRQIFEGVKSFVFGNREDRNSLERGAGLSILAASQNSVANIPFNARPEIAQFLDQFSDVRSSAFGLSNRPGEKFRSGREVQQDIISSDLQRPLLFGGLGLDKQQADAAAQKIATPREEKFITDLAAVFRDEQQSRSDYERLVSNLPVEFENKATSAFQKFVDDLRNNVKVEQDARNKEKEGSIKQQLNPVQREIGDYENLARFGVSDNIASKQALGLATRKRDITEQRNSLKEADKRINIADTFSSGVISLPGTLSKTNDRDTIDTFIRNAVTSNVVKGGYKDTEIPQIYDSIYTSLNNKSKDEITNVELARTINQALTSTLSRKGTSISKQEADLNSELSEVSTDVKALMDNLYGLNDVEFSQVSSGINALTTSLIELQKTSVKLSEDLARLKPAEGKAKGGPLYFTGGGGIGPDSPVFKSTFRPKGNDKVPGITPGGQPIMMEPEEFIVRKKVAKENEGLLMALNSGRLKKPSFDVNNGTVYAAEGGFLLNKYRSKASRQNADAFAFLRDNGLFGPNDVGITPRDIAVMDGDTFEQAYGDKINQYEQSRFDRPGKPLPTNTTPIDSDYAAAFARSAENQKNPYYGIETDYELKKKAEERRAYQRELGLRNKFGDNRATEDQRYSLSELEQFEANANAGKRVRSGREGIGTAFLRGAGESTAGKVLGRASNTILGGVTAAGGTIGGLLASEFNEDVGKYYADAAAAGFKTLLSLGKDQAVNKKYDEAADLAEKGFGKKGRFLTRAGEFVAGTAGEAAVTGGLGNIVKSLDTSRKIGSLAGIEDKILNVIPEGKIEDLASRAATKVKSTGKDLFVGSKSDSVFFNKPNLGQNISAEGLTRRAKLPFSRNQRTGQYFSENPLVDIMASTLNPKNTLRGRTNNLVGRLNKAVKGATDVGPFGQNFTSKNFNLVPYEPNFVLKGPAYPPPAIASKQTRALTTINKQSRPVLSPGDYRRNLVSIGADRQVGQRTLKRSGIFDSENQFLQNLEGGKIRIGGPRSGVYSPEQIRGTQSTRGEGFGYDPRKALDSKAILQDVESQFSSTLSRKSKEARVRQTPKPPKVRSSGPQIINKPQVPKPSYYELKAAGAFKSKPKLRPARPEPQVDATQIFEDVKSQFSSTASRKSKASRIRQTPKPPKKRVNRPLGYTPSYYELKAAGFFKSKSKIKSRKRFESGGRVSGPSGRDIIPAYLSDGEYVINKKAAANIGYGNLDRANYLAKGGKPNDATSMYGGRRAQKARDRYAESDTANKIKKLKEEKDSRTFYMFGKSENPDVRNFLENKKSDDLGRGKRKAIYNADGTYSGAVSDVLPGIYNEKGKVEPKKKSLADKGVLQTQYDPDTKKMTNVYDPDEVTNTYGDNGGLPNRSGPNKKQAAANSRALEAAQARGMARNMRLGGGYGAGQKKGSFSQRLNEQIAPKGPGAIRDQGGDEIGGGGGGNNNGNKQAALGNLDGLSQALVNFADPASKLAEALKSFKGEITVNFNASPLQVVHGGTVNVAKDIEGIVSTAINNGIRQFIDANMPGLRSASPSKTPMSSDSAIA